MYQNNIRSCSVLFPEKPGLLRVLKKTNFALKQIGIEMTVDQIRGLSDAHKMPTFTGSGGGPDLILGSLLKRGKFHGVSIKSSYVGRNKNRFVVLFFESKKPVD